MTAKADSRYQHALQFAAGIRRRAATAALKKTYAASVMAVAATTPAAISGSICVVYGDRRHPLADVHAL
jgi:hypothetical protein